MRYIWQFPEWPKFRFNIADIQALFLEFAVETGEVTGIVQSLGADLQQEALLQTMLSEAIKSSEIEGEYISRQDIMSSLRGQLGLDKKSIPVKDKRASGIAQLMLSVRSAYTTSLSTNVLKDWHKSLMEGNKYVTRGQWRTGGEPMQIVSGTYGKEVVHYEAPPSTHIPQLMEDFVGWYNQSIPQITGEIPHALLKSAIAHLYFESIHPFEDGNGRIGRAISKHALAYFLKRPVFLSLSKIIEKEKNTYYAALKKAQGSLDITEWLLYFVKVIIEAQKDVKMTAQFILKKAKFFDEYKHLFNERQMKVINKMLDQGTDGFEGGMTARKYVSINKTSKASATRDLQELTDMGVFQKRGSGRAVKYDLNI